MTTRSASVSQAALPPSTNQDAKDGSALTPDEAATIPWLSALPPEERVRTIGAIRVKKVQVHETICRAGAEPLYWIGVVSGLVKMTGMAESGGSVTFAGFPVGGWFGEGTIIKRQRYQYDIKALQRSTLACLPVNVFEQLLRTSLTFNQFLLRQFNDRLGHFIAYKAAEQTLSHEARLAQALATLFDPAIYPRGGCRLKISQQELAYLVGTSRQQVNESLQVLQERGAIRVEYGAVCLMHYETLRSNHWR